MIRQIPEGEFVDTFFDLMAEVECGEHFDSTNAAHVEWVRRRVAVNYFRGARFFAYYLNNKSPVGFAAVLIDKGLEGVPCFGQYTELLDIAVLPQHRGKGYGAELIKHAERLSREAGAYCMYMTTYAGNHKLIAFYGKHGYVPVATMPDVHGPGDEGHVWMRKILRQKADT